MEAKEIEMAKVGGTSLLAQLDNAIKEVKTDLRHNAWRLIQFGGPWLVNHFIIRNLLCNVILTGTLIFLICFRIYLLRYEKEFLNLRVWMIEIINGIGK